MNSRNGCLLGVRWIGKRKSGDFIRINCQCQQILRGTNVNEFCIHMGITCYAPDIALHLTRSNEAIAYDALMAWRVFEQYWISICSDWIDIDRIFHFTICPYTFYSSIWFSRKQVRSKGMVYLLFLSMLYAPIIVVSPTACTACLAFTGCEDENARCAVKHNKERTPEFIMAILTMSQRNHFHACYSWVRISKLFPRGRAATSALL